ncbi:MAG: threonine-phosphate decarboxylase CobD [Boseongicola sp.]|nr:threonine-phosphate decarboxylase CobD [Boseongicola sp.]
MTKPGKQRDHGGNLGAAIHRFGGSREDWIDLSTGINPDPYPLPDISHEAWARLPDHDAMERLRHAAKVTYTTEADVVPFGGAQGAIQAIPHILPKGRAKVVAPTYNEHAGSLQSAGWDVEDVVRLSELEGADVGVVVNPNNPDGRHWTMDEIAAASDKVGVLVVDESFADPAPHVSFASELGDYPNVIILRSFGKFYGLAGVRLGFALASSELATSLKTMAGPWPISGPAIEIACAALGDIEWKRETTTRLAQKSERLDGLANSAGWNLVGGTTLFRTYDTADAVAAQTILAEHQIWTRIFPYSERWIRLGLPEAEDSWVRLERALFKLS